MEPDGTRIASVSAPEWRSQDRNPATRQEIQNLTIENAWGNHDFRTRMEPRWKTAGDCSAWNRTVEVWDLAARKRVFVFGGLGASSVGGLESQWQSIGRRE